MTAVQTERDAAAQRAVLRQLELAHEMHSINEQMARTTDPAVADDYHEFAVRLLRARIAEEDDPTPPGPCSCQKCSMAYFTGGFRSITEGPQSA